MNVKERIKEIEKQIPVKQIIYGYKPANEKQEILYEEYTLLKQLDDLYSSSWFKVIVGQKGENK